MNNCVECSQYLNNLADILEEELYVFVNKDIYNKNLIINIKSKSCKDFRKTIIIKNIKNGTKPKNNGKKAYFIGQNG